MEQGSDSQLAAKLVVAQSVNDDCSTEPVPSGIATSLCAADAWAPVAIQSSTSSTRSVELMSLRRKPSDTCLFS